MTGCRRSWRNRNGHYLSQPDWYRNFLYREEQARGLDAVEDLAAPGVFEFNLSEKPAVLMLAAVAGIADPGQEGLSHALARPGSTTPATELFADVRASELHRRKEFLTPLHRAADAYLVRRGSGKTIVAGYPWFGDWGRDAFISIRGLCIASGRLEDARDILVEWAGVVSEGMLPNRFPDQGDQPEFNSVDASLWYVIAVGDYLRAVAKKPELTGDHHT